MTSKRCLLDTNPQSTSRWLTQTCKIHHVVHPVQSADHHELRRCIVASITPDALEDYKELIRDATSDLHEHVDRLDKRIQSLAASEVESPARQGTEWLAMLEEMQSTQQGLRLCSQLSTQIQELESTSKEHPQFQQQPSAYKYIRSGLGAAKGSIHSLMSRLQTHENEINKRMETMKLTLPLSEDEAKQIAQLQEIRESIHQCMNVVSDAGQTLTDHRYNIFEDITMTDKSYGICVSTVKDLVIARRVNLKDEARYVGGQLSDEGYQNTIDKLTQLDQAIAQSSGRDIGQKPDTSELKAGSMVDRYGRGFKLPPSATLAKPSEGIP